MRKEPFNEGHFVHIIRRGTRGLPIVREEADRWRFLKVLYYLNDGFAKVNGLREIENEVGVKKFSWPETWPERSPLFSLGAFTLLNNHLHIIGLETKKGGISKFMQKSGISMAKHFNEKYREKGTLFQGAYHAKVIDEDRYLRLVVPYVMVKNTFEMHPKGLTWAVQNFDAAWQWAIAYNFSSLADYGGERHSPIIDAKPLKDILGGPKEFKRLCQDMISGRKEKPEDPTAIEIAGLCFENEN